MGKRSDMFKLGLISFYDTKAGTIIGVYRVYIPTVVLTIIFIIMFTLKIKT